MQRYFVGPAAPLNMPRMRDPWPFREREGRFRVPQRNQSKPAWRPRQLVTEPGWSECLRGQRL